MMTSRTIVLFQLLSCVILQGSCQSTSSTNGNLSEIPWILDRRIEQIIIPDSVTRGKHVNGSVIVILTIDKDGKRTALDIPRLLIEEKGKEEMQCTEFNQDKPSKECEVLLHDYRSLLENVLSTTKLVRAPHSIEPQEKNKLGLTIKLKSR